MSNGTCDNDVIEDLGEVEPGLVLYNYSYTKTSSADVCQG